jgi:hypothetical protein
MQMRVSVVERDGEFHAYVSDRLLASSKNRMYVMQKAKKILGQSEELPPVRVKDDTPINTKFDHLTDLVKMVATKETASCVVVGEGGLGKTYTVLKALEAAGLRDVSECDVDTVVDGRKCFRVVKGFSTAKGLFRILHENKDSILVFDDCDSVLKDPDSLNLLKGALDSYDKRLITWNTSIDNDGLPRMFQFKGGVIFISNMPMEKISQAIRSRSLVVDLTMSKDQKIERMRVIAESDQFLPDIDRSAKVDALNLIDEMKDNAREISLRTLISVTKIRSSSVAKDWKALAKYVLLQAG